MTQYPVSAQYSPLSGLVGMLSGYVPNPSRPAERPTTKPCNKCGTMLPFADYRIIDDSATSKSRKRSRTCPECESKPSAFEMAITAIYETLGDRKLTAKQLSELTEVNQTTVRVRMNVLIDRKMVKKSKKQPYLYSKVPQ